MRIKNHYAWICAIWIISVLLDTVNCVVKFVEGEIIIGFIFLILAVAFAFVSGILLQKAIAIYQHNKVCEFLEDIHEFLKEQNEPFEEFNNENRQKEID